VRHGEVSWQSRGVPRRAVLSLNEWAVLGVLAEGSRHGYDVAAALGRDADLGRVWRVSRPLVYRALERLQALELVTAQREEPGEGGPRRTVHAVTRRGRSALRSWLGEPVAHLRDIRSELLLKLVLARRLGIDPSPLVAAQRAVLADQLGGLRRRPRDGDAVALWRHHSAMAADRFLVDLQR
jgi:PadR family transcriptional regulator AphA